MPLPPTNHRRKSSKHGSNTLKLIRIKFAITILITLFIPLQIYLLRQHAQVSHQWYSLFPEKLKREKEEEKEEDDRGRMVIMSHRDDHEIPNYVSSNSSSFISMEERRDDTEKLARQPQHLLFQKEEKEKETKRILILHVGPPKTGTTTLQNGLFQIQSHLKLDSYDYLVRYDDLSVNTEMMETVESNNNTSTYTNRQGKNMRRKYKGFVWSVRELELYFKTLLSKVTKQQDKNQKLNFVENQGIDYDKEWDKSAIIKGLPKEFYKQGRYTKYKEYKKNLGQIKHGRRILRAKNEIKQTRRYQRGNYKYDPHHNHDKKKKNKHFFDRFIRHLDACYDNHRSVIISAEQLCFNDKFIPDHPNIWDVFLPPLQKWDVRVVVTYRRYYEWITSYYYQHNLMRIFPHRKETLVSFVTKIIEQARILQSEGRWIETHPTYHAYAKYKRHFKSVNILNFHDQDQNIVKMFICDFIPNAANACLHVSNATVDHPVLRQSTGLDFYLLIQAAIENKMIHILDNKQFGWLVDKANEFYNEEYQQLLPYKCLSEDLTDEIFKMSQSFEKDLVPEWYHMPGNQIEHREGFLRAVENKKFCDLDYERVLLEKEWKDFFLRCKRLLA